MCKIGTWKDVSIPWLSHTEDPYIQTENEAIKDKMVASLMIIEYNQWDEDLINEISFDKMPI